MALLLAALAAPAAAAAAAPPRPDAAAVHTVHLVFSHHLDIGLNEALRTVGDCKGFATTIVQEYFDDFIPQAISLAKEINSEFDSPTDDGRFAYTIHPWIASLYVDCVPWDIYDGCSDNPGKLRCPDAAQVAAFDDAVRRGELLWADSPFNVNAGIVGEPGMFEALFDIAGALNERYNLSKSERVWSNVDVPGFARSSIPLLRRAGATALSVCANVGGMGNGTVPTEFVGNSNATMWRWHDPASGEEILVLYHKAQRDTMSKIPLKSTFTTYGGYTRPDNTIITPGGTALASYVASDNTGPPTKEQVKAIFKDVREVFPNAKTVFGSTWESFAADVTPEEAAALPRFSSEWGDQWVRGMPNDPGRLATYRAIIRARAACIAAGACQPRDPVLRNFTRFAAKNAEHTQGVEGGAMQPGAQSCIWGLSCPGNKDWKNDAFAKVHNAQKNIFPGADDSWLEDRLFNALAVQAVPPAHPLAPFLRGELAALVPRSSPSLPSFNGSGAGTTVACGGTTLQFSSTGALANLTFGPGGEPWSRLMDLRYISYRDESKKGVVCDQATCPNPVAGAWEPTLLGFWSDASAAGPANGSCRVVMELGFNATLHTDYGAPERVTAEYTVDPAQRRVNVTLTWRNKTTTRLQEAMTVFHRPAPRAGHSWEMDILGEWVRAANVTAGGEQYQHAVWTGVRYAAAAGGAAAPGLRLGTLDAGMVCPVLNTAADPALTPERSLLASCFDYDIRDPAAAGVDQQLDDAMIDGLGVNLHANRFTISGFPQWYPFGVGDRYQQQDATTQFRFVVEER